VPQNLIRYLSYQAQKYPKPYSSKSQKSHGATCIQFRVKGQMCYLQSWLDFLAIRSIPITATHGSQNALPRFRPVPWPKRSMSIRDSCCTSSVKDCVINTHRTTYSDPSNHFSGSFWVWVNTIHPIPHQQLQRPHSSTSNNDGSSETLVSTTYANFLTSSFWSTGISFTLVLTKPSNPANFQLYNYAAILRLLSEL
jgi:hypothetical protein